MKKIALIGKPNVGKSSLFNRLAKERIAITSDVSGTTRDVRYKDIEIDGRECTIVDTGGLDSSSELFTNVRTMSLKAASQADIILFLVDGKMIPDDKEQKLFFELQKLNKPIALVVNKTDNEKEVERAWEFYQFGAEFIFPISVSHNRGFAALIKWLCKYLPAPKEESLKLDADDDFSLEDILIEEEKVEVNLDDDKTIHVAIIGKVNVGKSSLLNALIGEDRAVVSDVAGTTIDPVDDKIIYNDTTITFVDTAGIRRRGKIEGIEKYALGRTESMLERADIALLVLDASEPFAELDERIASLVQKYELGCIIVLNKWDKALMEYKEAVKELRYKFKFLAFAPVITVSALSKKRIHKVNDMILEVFENYSRRIPTSKLNEVIKEATVKHQMPSDKTKVVKIYYATQFQAKPPLIALVMNRPKALHFSYKRYLVNKLREAFNFEGSPIVLIPRPRSQTNPENEQESNDE
ncbi:MAG: ribosome biogenesis GTPase Der [Campylobacteraceae bacterium]